MVGIVSAQRGQSMTSRVMDCPRRGADHAVPGYGTGPCPVPIHHARSLPCLFPSSPRPVSFPASSGWTLPDARQPVRCSARPPGRSAPPPACLPRCCPPPAGSCWPTQRQPPGSRPGAGCRGRRSSCWPPATWAGPWAASPWPSPARGICRVMASPGSWPRALSRWCWGAAVDGAAPPGPGRLRGGAAAHGLTLPARAVRAVPARAPRWPDRGCARASRLPPGLPAECARAADCPPPRAGARRSRPPACVPGGPCGCPRGG